MMKKYTPILLLILCAVAMGLHLLLSGHTLNHTAINEINQQPLDLQSLLLNPCIQCIAALLWGASLLVINAINKKQYNKKVNSEKQNNHTTNKPHTNKILVFLSTLLFIYGVSILYLHWSYICSNIAPLISLLIYHTYNPNSSHLDYYTWKRTLTAAKEVTAIMTLAIIAPIIYQLSIIRGNLEVKRTL